MSIGADLFEAMVSHPVMERLSLASIELLLLGVIVTALTRGGILRAPRTVAIAWILVLAKPLVTLLGASVLVVISVERQAPAAAAGGGRGASTILLLAWAAGAGFFLARHLIVRFRVRWILLEARPAPRAIEARYRALASSLGIRRRPRLAVTTCLESPAVLGLFRGALLIPAWLAARPRVLTVDWSLKHELVHWKRRDPAAIFVRDIATILFYFHPFAWIAGRRLVDAIERACDAALVRADGDAINYAFVLHAMLTCIRRQRLQGLQGGLFATSSQVSMRIRAILEAPARPPRRLAPHVAAGVAVLAAALMVLGADVCTAPRPARTGNEPIASAESIAPAAAIPAAVAPVRSAQARPAAVPSARPAPARSETAPSPAPPAPRPARAAVAARAGPRPATAAAPAAGFAVRRASPERSEGPPAPAVRMAPMAGGG